MASEEKGMSPIHRKTLQLPPVTPGSIPIVGASSIQPSPNRTEAAAAMMHLLTGNTNQESTIYGAMNPKAKRRYVRRAPKKVGMSAKRQIKTAWMDSDTAAMEKQPVKFEAGQCAKTLEEGESDGNTNGGTRMDGDEVRFFPFREYNRKEKSLGLLCENFLKLYRDDKSSEICLDRAATELGVERRRIYDIVNILESIHLVSRKSKNLYNWHGLVARPTSVSAMKQRYADVRKSLPTGSSRTECPSFKNDRRRGKSLSKLSQMFVQLFLEKEDCIIPLDQAAKQLIQMEDSESVEDRLLKTKIRRLYDVANVLVSVGLIEKLQLSNSRKPLFRWKTRRTVPDPKTPETSADSRDGKEAKPSGTADYIKTEVVPSNAEADNIDDAMKSLETCNSDMSDDGSESQSDASSGGLKRRQNDQNGSDASMSESESSIRRNWFDAKQEDMVNGSAPTTGETSVGLLRMDANNKPIHPQIIFCQQQEQVKLYMQQYIREYVDYVAAHQHLPHHVTPVKDGAQVRGNLIPASASQTNAVATITNDIHGTPVSLPSLAGSIQDWFLSEKSPQSVAEVDTAEASTKSVPPATTTFSGNRPQDP